MQWVHLLSRQAAEAAATTTCNSSNNYDGRMGLRISSIFVILFGSTLGAVFPVYARRHRGLGVPDWVFFIAKYFGSGVIIATAFIHLLAPANEALGNECLQGPITEYPWVEGIALMTIFLMFFLEIMTMRYGIFGGHSHSHEHADEHSHDHSQLEGSREDHHHNHNQDRNHTNHGSSLTVVPGIADGDAISLGDKTKYTDSPDHDQDLHHHVRGDDHLGHSRDHKDNDMTQDWEERGLVPESYAAQMTGIFILEFGVIFHSIFIGLTLAVAGDEFVTLYVILVFHQTFEGLGLGSRLATLPWPKSKRWTPYLLALGYGISTPIAIAVGLGVRKTYPPESQTTLIVNGIFDSISAGILIYTGLVELMAHEFMFSPYMQKGPVSRLLSAFLLMCLGAGLMALLGKWA